MQCQNGCWERPRRIERMERCYSGRIHHKDGPNLPGVFKLLGGSSEVWYTSTQSQLYHAIALIFSFSVCKVKEFLHPNWPYINVQIGLSPSTATLYDSGPIYLVYQRWSFRSSLCIRGRWKSMKLALTTASALGVLNWQWWAFKTCPSPF